VRTGFASGRRRGPSPDVPGRRAGRRVTPVTRAPRRGAVRRDPRSARRARDASMRAAQVDDLTTWMTGGAGARRAPRSCVQARSSEEPAPAKTCHPENLAEIHHFRIAMGYVARNLARRAIDRARGVRAWRR
jgi:hypothetical protein